VAGCHVRAALVRIEPRACAWADGQKGAASAARHAFGIVACVRPSHVNKALALDGARPREAGAPQHVTHFECRTSRRFRFL